MAHKNFSQLSLTQYLTHKTIAKTKTFQFLYQVNTLVDWEPIKKTLSHIHSSQYGRPAYPPLLMFKILLLQRWFNLSDPAVEEEINDRLSFKYFLGLPPEEPAPDETTLVKFRKILAEQDLIQPLFEKLESQCQKWGLTIKSGAIIDSSTIQAAINPPSKASQKSPENKNPAEETESKNQKTPEAPPQEDLQRVSYETFPREDPEASWAVKTTPSGKKVCTYGYKLHICVDDTYGLIRAFKVSTGADHDLRHASDLLPKEKGVKVFADKAYWSREFLEEIERRGLKPEIMKKAPPGRKLSQEEKRRNAEIGKVRRKGEKTFGILKHVWGLGRTIYVGLKKNQLLYGLACIAFDLKLLVRILSGGGRARVSKVIYGA